MVSSFGKVAAHHFKVNEHSVLLPNTFVGYIAPRLHAAKHAASFALLSEAGSTQIRAVAMPRNHVPEQRSDRGKARHHPERQPIL